MIKLHEIIDTEDQTSIVMEHAALRSLFSSKFWEGFNKFHKLDTGNRLITKSEALRITRGILEAIEYSTFYPFLP